MKWYEEDSTQCQKTNKSKNVENVFSLMQVMNVNHDSFHKHNGKKKSRILSITAKKKFSEYCE